MRTKRSSLLYVVCLLLGSLILGGGRLETAVFAAADIGFRGPEFRTSGVSDPTGEKPQSKLWFHDGKWWGNLFDKDSETFHIYQLDWETQAWSDTGVEVDDRHRSRADVLADGDYLYVASSSGSLPVRLYRFSYADGTYSLDDGFPVQISDDDAEIVVLDKDSTGTLWITYVENTKLYVAHSDGADDEWVEPYVLPTTNATGLSGVGEISSIVAYNGYVGVMWSHQPDNSFYFAVHEDGTDDDEWQEVVAYGLTADDHVSLRGLQADDAGNVFAVVKGAFDNVGEPQIILLACVDGNCNHASHWEAHTAFARTAAQNKTRPNLLLDSHNREVYVFATTTGGGNAYYKKSSYDNISFPSGDGTTFIDFGPSVNDVTSTKQTLDVTTGLVAMVSGGTYYYHNCIELNGSGVCPDPNKASIVQFSSATYDVDEGDGQATITVERQLATDTVVSVDYVASNGTATSGEDFDAVSGTLTFAAGETEKTFAVPLTDDTMDEDDLETVALTLSNPTNDAGLGTNATSTINISDNDARPTVQFTTATFSAHEAIGAAEITVELSAASGLEITVGYLTVDITAVSPADYEAVPLSTLTFPPGTTSQTFGVNVVDDALFEATEAVGLVLATPTNADLGTPDGATLDILDNEAAPTVQFATDAISVSEDGGTADVEVTLSSLSPASISVDYVVTAGTAVAGEDYTDVAPGTITFAPGQDSKLITIPVLDDAQNEADETILLALSNVSDADATLGTPDEATVTIENDDVLPKVQVDPASYTVAENAGDALVTVTLDAASGQTVTVDYEATAGTAVAGTDFTVVSDTVTFAPGETSQTVAIPLLDDALDEADETLQLTISNPINANIGTDDDATVTIEDDDASPTVQFEQASYQTREDLSAVSLVVTLSEASGQELSVRYATGGGTATGGGDYANTSGKLTFAPGETSMSIEVGIFDDAHSEAQETAEMTLSNPENVALGTPSVATLTILDDDQPALTPDNLNYSVRENAGTMTIALTLEYALTQPASVDFVLVDMDATVGEDYTAVSGAVVFAPGETSQTIEIEILEDELDEADEQFKLVFSNPVNMFVEVETLTITIENFSGAVIYLPVIHRMP